MIHKLVIASVTTLIAVFGIGRVRAFAPLGQFGCQAASAQESWNDGGDNDSESDEVSTEPEMTPSVAGDWSGSMDDRIFHTGFMDMAIDQTGGRLSGTWTCDLCLDITRDFTGSISSGGTLHFKLNDGGKNGKCNLIAVGMLVGAHEISGTYKFKGCSKLVKTDHGNFDITN